jgi:cardiolipin synthase
VNAVGFFALFFLEAILIAIYVDGALARRLVVWQLGWLAAGTAWMLAHVGLLRDRNGHLSHRIGLPNQLSFLRLLLIPSLYLFLVEGQPGLALVAYGTAGISDVLDGYVARRWGPATRLGLVLDPLVDVSYIVAIFAALHQVGIVPTWLMVLVWVRYAVLFVGGTVLYLAKARLTIAPTAYGRISGVIMTVINFGLLVWLLLGRLDPASDLVAVLMVGLGFLYSAAVVQLVGIGIHNLRRRDPEPGPTMATG